MADRQIIGDQEIELRIRGESGQAQNDEAHSFSSSGSKASKKLIESSKQSVEQKKAGKVDAWNQRSAISQLFHDANNMYIEYFQFYKDENGKTQWQMMVVQGILMIGFYVAYIFIMGASASTDWDDALSLYLLICLLGFIGLWNLSRRTFVVHYKEWAYNIAIFGFFFALFMGVYVIVFYDIQSSEYNRAQSFEMISLMEKQIQGEGGREYYGIIPVAIQTGASEYLIGCACFSNRATDDIFSGRPQVYAYTYAGEDLDGNLIRERLKYKDFSQKKIPAWKCIEIPTEIEENVGLADLPSQEVAYFGYLEADSTRTSDDSELNGKFQNQILQHFGYTNIADFSIYVQAQLGSFSEDFKTKSLDYCLNNKAFVEVQFQEKIYYQEAIWIIVLLFIQVSFTWGCSWLSLVLSIWMKNRVLELIKKQPEVNNPDQAQLAKKDSIPQKIKEVEKVTQKSKTKVNPSTDN